MSTELAKTQGSAIEQVNENTLIGFLDTLGLTSKLNDAEKKAYIGIAQAFNLNPFKREIHVSKYGDQMSVITGYEVYIKRAERTGQLDGWKATTTGNVENGDLKAIVTIFRKDRQHPFEWEALYSECVQTTKEGKPTKFWQKAAFMTKKVAISQAFRLCFSDELAGMPYTSDEMPDNNTEDATYTVVEPALADTRKTMRVGDKLFVGAIKALQGGKSLDDIKAAVIIPEDVEKELMYAVEQAA